MKVNFVKEPVREAGTLADVNAGQAFTLANGTLYMKLFDGNVAGRAENTRPVLDLNTGVIHHRECSALVMTRYKIVELTLEKLV